MNTYHEYIEKIRLTSWAAWMVIVVMFIISYRYLRDVTVFVLQWLYEFFIGNKGYVAPYG
jgi:hypothetical protein